MLQALLTAALSVWVFLLVLASPDDHGRPLMPRDNDPASGANTSALPPGWPAGGGFCWEEGDPFLLGPSFNDSIGMTIESCVDFCDRQENRIAGLVAGYQCSCGVIINPDTNFESEGPDLCMTPCAGNAAEFCGGDESIVVFTKDDGRCSLGRDATLGIGPWRFVDLYNDTVGSRALPHNAVDLHPPLVRGNLTLEACFNACGAAGYLLAGVEYADECYCGNELENFSQPITPCAADFDLMACKGDTSEVCGGPDKLYVYTLPGSGLVPEIPFDTF